MAGRTLSSRVLWLVVLFVVSLPAVTTRINASDEIQFFAWLPSWTFDRDVDFDNEYRRFYDAGPGRYEGFVETFLSDVNEAGRRQNFTPIGSAILWLPFYAGGHVVAHLSGAPTDGFSRPYIAGVTYGSALYGFLALLLSADIARRLLGRRQLLPAVLIWIGTPLLFYMYVAPGFAHACSAFAVSLFLWVWLRVRDRWTTTGVACLAVAGALLPMVREQDVFFLAGPALDFLRWSWRQQTMTGDIAGRRTEWSSLGAKVLVGLGVLALAYTPQLLAYQALNGHPGPTVKVMRKMTWTSPHFFQVLFSPEHGLFIWTPLALAAMVGLVWLCVRPPATATVREPSQNGLPAAEIRWIATLMMLMILLQVYVSGSVESWTVAGAFGQRRFVALTPLLVVGLAALRFQTDTRRAWRAAAACAAALAVWWNIGLMVQFGLHLMDRQRLSIVDNARVTFLELPYQLPSIAARYLVDRESFYGQPRQ